MSALNPVTPVVGGALVSTANPLPVALTGGIPDTGLTQTMDAEAAVVTTLTLTPATSGAAPFKMAMTSFEYTSVWDTYVGLGFNLFNYSPFSQAGAGTANKPTYLMAFENDFFTGGNHTMEWYLQYLSPDASSVDIRPIYTNVLSGDNSVRQAEITFDMGGSGGSLKMYAKGVSAGTPYFSITSATTTINTADFNMTAGLATLSHPSSTAFLTIGSNSAGSTNSALRWKGGSGKFNFQASVSGITTNNAWEVTPSTAADGGTYSAPALSLTAAGTLLVGKAAAAAALATNATTGFLVIPGSAGTPSGTPANAGTGQFAMQYDSTANKIWVYNGSWRGILVV